MTQNQWLLRHLTSGKSITTFAAHKAGICRLSERVRELSRQGHEIVKARKTIKTRFGSKTPITIYRLWEAK